ASRAAARWVTRSRTSRWESERQASPSLYRIASGRSWCSMARKTIFVSVSSWNGSRGTNGAGDAACVAILLSGFGGCPHGPPCTIWTGGGAGQARRGRRGTPAPRRSDGGGAEAVERGGEVVGDLVRVSALDLVALEHEDHVAVLEEGDGGGGGRVAAEEGAGARRGVQVLPREDGGGVVGVAL